MSQLKNELYNRINLKFEEYPDFFYINDKSKIKYKSILKIWSDFVYKIYSNKLFISDDEEIYQEKNKSHRLITKLCKINLNLAIVLEDLFKYHVTSDTDDLILFYIKGSNKILIKLKSYAPLAKDETHVLPYWNIFITDEGFIKHIDEYVDQYKENTLCIICF